MIIPGDNKNFSPTQILVNLTVFRTKYAPKKLSLLTSPDIKGGIPESIKKYPWLIFLYPFMMCSLIVKSFQQCKKNTIIHSHWIPNGLVGVILNKLKGVPNVVTVRGSDQKLLNIPIIKNICGWILKNSSQVTTVSKDLSIKINKEIRLKKKSIVIPNGVDVPLKKTKFNKTKKSIIFVGSITKNKNISCLINAFQIVINDCNVKLKIIGDGPELKTIVKSVEDKNLKEYIDFLGVLPHDKVISHMQCSDFLILPSFMEGAPNVIREAMSCGIPVIATSVGGIPEMIKEGEHGLLFEPNDTIALSNHISFLCKSDVGVLEKMGEKARQYIINNCLSWSDSAAIYSNLYEDLLNQNKLPAS